eukprot:TRINITY_DN7446_c0_g1_i2.p1 TRINITY_DN7446_c0_g1~~TRINITY_DN7446_c0_g1_i2.p1  ORF type:complete len:332 (+),score=30.55 TRINITY_DN7446_c0_g1_i2:332-1327(+)
MVYIGFFYVSLYKWDWAERRFSRSEVPLNIGKLLHNIWYSLLGAVQFSVFWELAFIYGWRFGKIDYVSDYQILDSAGSLIWFVLGCFYVPVYRIGHFYFTHRFSHIHSLYRFVHSLHHRNTDDIEPFSGLCMHPIEHLYYISCVGVSLFIWKHPFLMLWNAVHLLISPAAAHSGWEDAMQSDVFHFIHHAKFECNYGTVGVPFDSWFGTFRDTIGNIVATSTRTDEYKLVFRNLFPKVENMIYNMFAASIYLVYFGHFTGWLILFEPKLVAFYVSVLPILMAFILNYAVGNQKPLIWPFHKEPFHVFWFHVLVAVCVSVVPIYVLVISVIG